jgi:hypothetical protein
VLPFALVLLLSQTPQHRLFQQPNMPRASLAAFEAFGLGRQGVTSVCSTTPPTGARGEVLTFTRASAATCTRTAAGGLATTGIADGDLVSVTNNIPRQEFDSAGTTLGLLLEAQRINSTLRSEELTNGAWASNNSGIALPTVTADAATAPDGTATADRLQIPGSTTGGQYSQLYQVNACPAGASAQIGSYYIKGVSGSGSICFKIGTAVSTCSYVSTSWTRCLPTINAVGSTTVAFAVDVTACGANAAGVDAYVWGVQCENSGAYATSYIPTVAAAATRVNETAYFTVPSMAVRSMANTVTIGGGLLGANTRIIGDAQGSTKTFTGYSAGPTAAPLHAYQGWGAPKDLASSTNVVFNSSNRLAVWFIPSTTIGTVVNGTQTTSSAAVQDAVTDVTKFYPGNYAGGAGYNTDSIHSRICLDPDENRCR